MLRMFVLCCCLAGLCCACAGRESEPVLETYVEDAAEEPQQSSEAGQMTGDTRAVLKEEQSGTDEKQVSGTDTKERSGTDAEQTSGTDVKTESGRKEESKPDSGADADGMTGSDDATAAPELTVHVCGAVRREGVYTLPAGSRIRDAVEAAGGFSADADSSWLNLAAGMQDAWQIRVPTKEETEKLRAGADPSAGYGIGFINGSPGGEQQQTSIDNPETGAETGSPDEGKIDLNTASREELMKIPGVGDSKAGKILEYREQNGRFETIEDLMKVPGIKNASFQKMKDYVTVS